MFKKLDKDTINTACNIIRAATAIAALAVSIVSCQGELEHEPEPQKPFSTKIILFG
ncbi:MAG: hypothetical protein QNJ70_07135 [Xenococcaceae cyanobacterium MO_207.B15]|nr:hypothetical protein [Xenococcaceae cyanobacterium MO_207.B15]